MKWLGRYAVRRVVGYLAVLLTIAALAYLGVELPR